MSLPRAVLEAEEKANKLHEELLKQQQSPEATDPPTEGEQTPPAADPEPPKNQDGSPPPQEDNWEHRFKVLQGKYNSEVPRFAQENKELKSRLESLEDEINALKSTPAEPLVKPEEIEEYGPGLVDLARRIAQEELRAKDAKIEKLERQLSGIAEVTTNTAKNDFFRSLGAMVPDWERINEDPAFLKWLDEVDELTGETRLSLLSKAEVARDAARAAKFFQAYSKTSSSWAAKANDALESQIVPPTNKTPETPPSKRMWTRAEITDFYSRLRRGEVSDQDAIAIEADITAASIEGRIR